MFPFKSNILFGVVIFSSLVRLVICQTQTDYKELFTPERLRAMPKQTEFQLSPKGTKILYTELEFSEIEGNDVASFKVMDISRNTTYQVCNNEQIYYKTNYHWLDDSRIGYTTYDGFELAFWELNLDTSPQLEKLLFKVEHGLPFITKYFEQHRVLVSFVQDKKSDSRYEFKEFKSEFSKLPLEDPFGLVKGQLFVIRPGTKENERDVSINLTKLIRGKPKFLSSFALSPDGLTLGLAFKISSDPPLVKILTIDINTLEVHAEVVIKSVPIFRLKFSPNGQFLIYTMSQGEMSRSYVGVLDLSTKEHRTLYSDWDISPTTVQFTGTGLEFIIEAEEHGNLALYKLDINHSTPFRLTGEGSYSIIGVNQENRIIAIKQSVGIPNRVVALVPNQYGYREKKLGDVFFDPNISYKLSRVEWFAFEGANKDTVHGMMLRPPNLNMDKKYPMILMIRGAPGISTLDTWDNSWNYQVLTQAGYVVVDINYHGSTGYGTGFARSIIKHPMDYPYHDLVTGIKFLIKKHSFIDESRIAAWGHSYGGFIVNYINGHNKDKLFKVLVSYSGIFDANRMFYGSDEYQNGVQIMGSRPYDPENSPLRAAQSLYHKYSPATYVGRWATPTLVVHSVDDKIVNIGEGYSTFSALQARSVPSKMITFNSEGHTLKDSQSLYTFYTNALNFTATWLK